MDANAYSKQQDFLSGTHAADRTGFKRPLQSARRALPLLAAAACFFQLWSSALSGGIDLMRKVNLRSRGQNSRMVMEMTIHDAKRGFFHKSIVMERARLASGYRTGYWITAPGHEKGIALLLSEDEPGRGMWMYFPASRQSVRVATRGFPALASDFSCDDLLVSVPLSDYEFRLLGKDRINGLPVRRVEMIPRNEDLRSELGFTKSVGWIREDIWMIVRADYYDEKGEVFKRFEAEDVENVQGVWTIRKFLMNNMRAQHSTEVEVKDVDYLSPVSQEALTPEQLGSAFIAVVKDAAR